jgi:hypothetical protein
VGSNPVFSIGLFCTASRRIPASASANQGSIKADLMAGGTAGSARRVHFPLPAEWDQILFFNRLDLYHISLNIGERQRKSRI